MSSGRGVCRQDVVTIAVGRNRARGSSSQTHPHISSKRGLGEREVAYGACVVIFLDASREGRGRQVNGISINVIVDKAEGEITPLLYRILINKIEDSSGHFYR